MPPSLAIWGSDHKQFIHDAIGYEQRLLKIGLGNWRRRFLTTEQTGPAWFQASTKARSRREWPQYGTTGNFRREDSIWLNSRMIRGRLTASSNRYLRQAN